MEFKHAFHVFVDNFSTTYKVLVYRLIVLAITIGLSCAVFVPAIGCISDTPQYTQLQSSITAMWSDVIELNTAELQQRLQTLREAFGAFEHLLSDKSWLVATVIVCMCVVYVINRFLVGIGNYVTGALVHDKMVMHTTSSFTFTLFKNIRQAALYAIIYAPLAALYDFICLAIIWAIIMVGMKGLTVSLIKIFIIGILFLVFSAIKYTFITDWLPALISAKMKQRTAFLYNLSRRGKRTASVLSNALVLTLILVALNVAAGIFTFGAGLLLTLPASSLILTAYCFVNYFDRNKLKYFVDEYTVIGPKKETPVSREEFFKGDE